MASKDQQQDTQRSHEVPRFSVAHIKADPDLRTYASGSMIWG
jgi:hypothetical protein